MFSAIVSVLLSLFKPAEPAVSQFQPCVWPNRCRTAVIAQFKPCVWPNTCGKTSV